MKNLAEELLGACNFCMHSICNEDGYWYCRKRRYKYFPEAEWNQDEGDTSECPSYEPDPKAFGDDDFGDDDFGDDDFGDDDFEVDDCEYDNDEPEDGYKFFDEDCDPDDDMSGESIYRGN